MSTEYLKYDSETQTIICSGDWTLKQYSHLQEASKNIIDSCVAKKTARLSLEGGSIKQMDSAGASLLFQLKTDLENKKIKVQLENFSKQHSTLLDFIEHQLPKQLTIPQEKKGSFLFFLGKATIERLNQFQEYLYFIGKLCAEALRLFRAHTRLRWPALANVVYRNGYQALSIIGLLSFMIGVVIAFQMGVQLRNYGANVYIVDFLGLSVLREFGPLLTAIMVAGRTGSAFTAQLGLMKINQEIDALDTMGVTPADILILPRIIGLFIALPLLTVWADIFGILGGMVMANNMLHLTWYDFLHRFDQVIPLRAFIIGFGKAPVFALIIATVACFLGMRVEGSAESVGKNTTQSVVLSIFFIIVVDAIFSVLLSKLNL